MENDLYNLAAKVGELLKHHNLMLATAESCTGGLVAATITDVPGSSHYFDRGFITYSNAAKIEMLGVRESTLETHGAVSVETAREMAEGVLGQSSAEVSLSVTGVAGPSGGTKAKPVGTVCFAWCIASIPTKTSMMFFAGDRTAIRIQAVQFALESLLQFSSLL
ncbi:MAG: CinA family protein [Gammaproteobacteria bacterium]|nr:CinA family protein [Gammaproteobacteria bacterium]